MCHLDTAQSRILKDSGRFLVKLPKGLGLIFRIQLDVLLDDLIKWAIFFILPENVKTTWRLTLCILYEYFTKCKLLQGENKNNEKHTIQYSRLQAIQNQGF